MGVKQLRKLTKEYREGVLSGRTDLADVVARLKLEAGNGFPAIEAEVAREKEELESRTRADDALPEASAEEVPGGAAESALAAELQAGAAFRESAEDGCAAGRCRICRRFGRTAASRHWRPRRQKGLTPLRWLKRCCRSISGKMGEAIVPER